VYYAHNNHRLEGEGIMKAAIVTGAGQAPILEDFSDPVPSDGERRIAVSAAAISQVVKSRASGSHYSSLGQFPFVVGIDGVGRLGRAPGLFCIAARALWQHGRNDGGAFSAMHRHPR
jgi:hypothetical protein